MPISLKPFAGGGGGGTAVEIGEVILMQKRPEPIIEIDGMTFLRSGHILINESSRYPEVFEKFGNLAYSSAVDWYQLEESPFGGLNLNKIVRHDSDWYAACGIEDGAGAIYHSTNVVDWTLSHSSDHNIKCIIRFHNSWYAFGEGGKVLMFIGGSWTVRSSFGEDVVINDAVVTNTPYLVIVGNNGFCRYTSNGIDWSTPTNTRFDTTNINSIGVWQNSSNTGYACGDDGAIATFSNVTGTWAVISHSAGTVKLNKVFYATNASTEYVVYLTDDGRLLRGTTYGGTLSLLTVAVFDGAGINDVVTGYDGQHLLVGDNGIMARPSANFSSFTKVNDTSFDTTNIMNINYYDGMWIAGGDNGKIGISPATGSIGFVSQYSESGNSASTQYIRIL